jgi:hypothetical protein
VGFISVENGSSPELQTRSISGTAVPAPEGSEDRKLARQTLVESAQLCSRQMSKAAWMQKIVILAPALVAIVGYEDLERIADYAWRSMEW